MFAQPETPGNTTQEQAARIVKDMAGRRPDFPSGKDFVDEVRRGSEPPEDKVEAVARIIRRKLIREMWAEPTPNGICDNCNNDDILWDCGYAEESLNKTAREILKLLGVPDEIHNRR